MINSKKELTGFKCRFRIEQRLVYHRDCGPTSSSYLDVMQTIASEFNGSLRTYERKSSNCTFQSILVKTSSKTSNTLLDLYFNQFPLFTGKRLDYLEWSKLLALTINGKHQTEEGLQAYLGTKANMNSRRSSWNWKHLISFYTLLKTLGGQLHGYAVSVW
jgi:hypothetical protein